MKKTVLISLSVLLLLIIVGVWAYLFVFGAPTGVSGIFANFGIGSGQSTEFEARNDSSDLSGEGDAPIVASTKLRQLTTMPVAGMTFTGTGSARYAEQGTGHIFDVSFSGGAETQVSNTTFTKVREALFSPDASHVVLTYEENGGVRTVLGTIEGGSLTTTTLLSAARNFGWSGDSDTLYYTLQSETGTELYAYSLTDETNTRIGTVPFGSVRALWGDTDYVYPKPAASLPGYLYRIEKGSIVPVSTGRFGLMAVPYEDGVIVTETVGETTLFSESIANGTTTPLAIAALPEKCAAGGTSSHLICAFPLTLTAATYPDEWYQGAVTMNDLLWDIHIDAGEADLIADPLRETGRALDVAAIVSNSESDQYLIVNKPNNTLWLFTPDL